MLKYKVWYFWKYFNSHLNLVCCWNVRRNSDRHDQVPVLWYFDYFCKDYRRINKPLIMSLVRSPTDSASDVVCVFSLSSALSKSSDNGPSLLVSEAGPSLLPSDMLVPSLLLDASTWWLLTCLQDTQIISRYDQDSHHNWLRADFQTSAPTKWLHHLVWQQMFISGYSYDWLDFLCWYVDVHFKSFPMKWSNTSGHLIVWAEIQFIWNNTGYYNKS